MQKRVSSRKYHGERTENASRGLFVLQNLLLLFCSFWSGHILKKIFILFLTFLIFWELVKVLIK